MSQFDKVTDLLDCLLTTSMAEACRRVGIGPRTPWRWLVQSRLGHPELQAIEFCGVTAPFHAQVQNAKVLMAHQIEASALERARDGVWVDTFFQGQRQYEKVLRPEFEGKTDDQLMFEVGADFKTVCYETRPTKTWLKPSDALVIKMVESWNRKRYGSHQTVAVNFGGVLRLEKDAPAKVIEATTAEVFEEEPEEAAEQRGGYLALAAPAKSSEEFEERAAAGEFDQSTVTFRNAAGEKTALRPDIELLRQQAAELKANGPKHKQPSHHVAVGKPDAGEEAEKPALTPQTLEDHPRAYSVPTPTPPKPRPSYSKDERNVGTGKEGLGAGADPSMVQGHRGFSISR